MVVNAPELWEAYTTLLCGIRLDRAFASGKSLLVTSTQPHEGKSTVACCLAIAAAVSGLAVLLVDGDLRRPSLAAAAGIRDGIGFGDILEGGCPTADTIYPIALSEDSLHCRGSLSIIGAGSKSPEFLACVDWSRARARFESLGQDYGLVLFDSPPILAVNDALLLSRIVDGVLLVVDADSANRYEVRHAREQLEPIGTPVIGVALNQFDPKLHGRPKQPYSGYNRGDGR
jgi:capsular exopolysaccharide synthesis family protein